MARPRKQSGKKYTAKDQLAGKSSNQCAKLGHSTTVVTNRKGQRFIECDRCGAFLGWA